MEEADCEFVYSPALVARLSSLHQAAGMRSVELLKHLSIITREARLCLRPYSRVCVGGDLLIEPVEAVLWFGSCQIRLDLIAIQEPGLLLLCLQWEAPVDECFWVDRVLNAVSLRMVAEGEGRGTGC